MNVVDLLAESISLTEVVDGGWTVFRDYEPPSPDKTITLVGYAGEPPDTTFQADYPAIQIRIRGAARDVLTPREKAEQVYRLLHGQSPIGAVENESLVYLIATQQPYIVQRDELERVTYAFSCRTMRT